MSDDKPNAWGKTVAFKEANPFLAGCIFGAVVGSAIAALFWIGVLT